MKRQNPRGDVVVAKNAEEVNAAIRRLAKEIAGRWSKQRFALLGILRRGRPLADRLAACIAEITGAAPPVGSLATTLYRDDLRAGKGFANVRTGETHFDFNVDGIVVIMVDDVLAAGRTTRAALDEVMDYGRPLAIQLACLVDRGGREMPIQPDYLGWTLEVRPDQYVSVRLKEVDGEDAVLLEPLAAPEHGKEGE